MAKGSARITSPEIIKEFRNRFALFDEVCRRVLSEVQWDIRKAAEWVQREQLRYWQKEVRQRVEVFHRAQLEYQRAHREAVRSPQSTAIDVRIAFEKAKRRREEAETKLRGVKKWMTLLAHDTGELMGPCLALSAQLEHLTPRALARLDRMVESLEAYLRTSPPDAPARPEEE